MIFHTTGFGLVGKKPEHDLEMVVDVVFMDIVSDLQYSAVRKP